MFNGSYEKQSNHVQTSGQNSSSASTSSSRRVNAADNPSSGFGFQYDFSQSDLQYQDSQYQLEDFQYQRYSQTTDSGSDVASNQVQTALTHPTPLSPGNYSREREAGRNNGATTPSSWGPGGHTTTPYWQPMPSNVHSGQTREAEATFSEYPASIVSYPPGLSVLPPSPGVYTRPNTQGIPASTRIWQLSQSWVDYEGGDDLYVITLFKKI